MTSAMTPFHHRPWLSAGLFLTTFATLTLEILDTRLLSVLTWYHLSFLAVSLAMLGMAAGAIHVFLGGERFAGPEAARALARQSLYFAISIPLSHVLNLCMPIPVAEASVMAAIAVATATVILGVPFFFSGVVVTIALTRAGGSIGALYAADLAGAACACLAIIPLLAVSNISSAAFTAGAAAALAVICFQRAALGTSARPAAALAAALVVAAVLNSLTPHGIGVLYPKGRWLSPQSTEAAEWNTHSYVTVGPPAERAAHFWGPGRGAERFRVTSSWVIIDGGAGTPITRWDGRRESIDWVGYDVTSLPYRLRRGDAGVIGVGGGRDILSALWGGSHSITGIEINGIILDLLTRRYRSFARIADQPGVTLIHDEARSYLARTGQRFDVLQMSLIDTWAATGAGAFTLTENGLYTLEGWRVFLQALKPGGVFSVSRWYASTNISETNRLLSLAVHALLDRGVGEPARQVVMVARRNVATLLVSAAPFTPEDLRRVHDVSEQLDFTVLVAPRAPAATAELAAIAGSRTPDALAAATAHPDFDFSAPTDERPYFFNMLKPQSFYRVKGLPRGGAAWGNLLATSTLVLLFFTAAILVAAIILWPLVRAGRPAMDATSFSSALARRGELAAAREIARHARVS